MRRRVVDHIPAREASASSSSAPAGCATWSSPSSCSSSCTAAPTSAIRSSTTLSALAALTDGGYVGREDGEALHDAYAFLRTLEHRIQLHGLRRTHVVPDDEASLRRLGRSMDFLKDPVGILDKTWQHHRREVRRLHEKLFYRPLLAAVARIPGDEARLSPGGRRASGWRALGFADPRAALRHLEALTSGLSRTAQIQRTLLPAMLGWFADAPDPDAGLFGFRRISESLGATPWYLSHPARRGPGRRAAGPDPGHLALRHRPAGARAAGRADARRRPRSRCRAEALTEEMLALAGRHDEPEAAVRAIRGDPPARAAPDRRRRPARPDRRRRRRRRAVPAHRRDPRGDPRRRRPRSRATQRGLDEAPTRMAIVAMGRYGGFELSYGSDADVMFVHDPLPGADPQVASSYAQAVANELRRLLALPGPDPALEIDADLRPEGKQGALVRTLDSYAAYYAKWSKVWEAQALLRADAVVGDLDLRVRFEELIDAAALPARGDLARTTSSRCAGSRPASTPSGCRAAPTRTPTSSSAAAGSPTSSGRPAAPDAVRRRRRGAAHLAHPRGARRRPRGRPGQRGRRRRAPAELAPGQPGPQRGHAGARQARRRAAARLPRARRRRLDPRLPARLLRRDGQRPAALHAAGPGRRRPGLLGVGEPRQRRALLSAMVSGHSPPGLVASSKCQISFAKICTGRSRLRADQPVVGVGRADVDGVTGDVGGLWGWRRGGAPPPRCRTCPRPRVEQALLVRPAAPAAGRRAAAPRRRGRRRQRRPGRASSRPGSRLRSSAGWCRTGPQPLVARRPQSGASKWSPAIGSGRGPAARGDEPEQSLTTRASSGRTVLGK